MVAADDGRTDATRDVSNFIRAGAIANHVAQIGYTVMGRRGIKAGGQRLKVGVNIADQQHAHAEPKIT